MVRGIEKNNDQFKDYSDHKTHLLEYHVIFISKLLLQNKRLVTFTVSFVIFFFHNQQEDFMKKRTLILLITILTLCFIISCNYGVSLPNNNWPNFEFLPDTSETLDSYLKDLNKIYDSFSKLEGTYDEQTLIDKADAHTYPEIGVFNYISSVKELGYGITKFKPGEKVKIRMGSSAYLVDDAFVVTSSGLNGPASVIMLEFLFGDPVLTVNEESYTLEDFPIATEAHISSALWDSGSKQPFIQRVEEGLYSINTETPSSIKSLEFQFKEKAEFFFTKAVFSKDSNESTIYSFEQPNEEGNLEFFIDKNIDNRDFDSILYYVAMLSSDGKYYTKTISIGINK